MTLKSCVFWVTYKCNFTCPYCREWRKAEKYPKEASVEDWLNFFRMFKDPIIIDFTGGEPFCYPNFQELVEKMPPQHKLAITTNLSLMDVDHFPVHKFFSITLSFHPSQLHKFTFQEFLAKAIKLKRRVNIPITVNFVAWKPQMEDIPMLKTIFEGLGFRFHVDPDGYATYTPQEIEYLKQFITDQRWCKGDQEKEKQWEKPRLCTAGMEHIHLFPDGTIKRCYWGETLGTIRNPQLYTEPKPCNTKGCAGCDYDKVRITWL